MRIAAVLIVFVSLSTTTTAFVAQSSQYRPTRTLEMNSASDSVEKAVAAAQAARDASLFYHTPLIKSAPLTALCKHPVYLKLDALQASGSFKDRGMAHLCHTLQQSQGVSKLVGSSGGNAGLALAVAGQQLENVEVAVVVPETTKKMVIEKLQSLGATVTVHGENWNAADLLAREMVVQRDDNDDDEAVPVVAAYVSPYDNPLLWTGHSTVIDEIHDDLPDIRNGAVVVSVGGGGLICGVFEGLERHELTSTKVVAAETTGASSFGQAFQKGELVRLKGIDSIATSLGALEVTPVALERAKQHQAAGGIVQEAICTDAEAVNACWKFAQDHRMLVEPACGAALAVAYSERLRKLALADVTGPIVIEVCGGSGVSLELLTQWKKDYLD